MLRLVIRRRLHRAKEAVQQAVAAALLHLVLRPLDLPVRVETHIFSMEAGEEEVTSEGAEEVIPWAEVGPATVVAVPVCRLNIVQLLH